MGMKLTYNADYNLKKKDGIILQKITKEEALEAVKLIQSIGIPVIAVPQESVPEYPLIHGIKKVTLREDGILFVSESAKTYDVPIHDIVYICLAQLPYLTYGRIEDGSLEDASSKVLDIFTAREATGTWTLLAKHAPKKVIKDLKFNRILDIFTGSGLRLRISNLKFTYEAVDKLKRDNDDSFAFMVEHIASLVGGGKIDENVELFISTSKWLNTYYRNVQELNHKGLWKMRLHLVYDQLLSFLP